MKHQAKHFFYASGWKKFEPLWDLMIRARQLRRVTPLLEAILSKVTRRQEPILTELPLPHADGGGQTDNLVAAGNTSQIP